MHLLDTNGEVIDRSHKNYKEMVTKLKLMGFKDDDTIQVNMEVSNVGKVRESRHVSYSKFR